MQEKLVDAYQSGRHLARIRAAPLVPKRQFTIYCASCKSDNVPFHSYPGQGDITDGDMPQLKHAKLAWVSLFAERAACRCFDLKSK